MMPNTPPSNGSSRMATIISKPLSAAAAIGFQAVQLGLLGERRVGDEQGADAEEPDGVLRRHARRRRGRGLSQRWCRLEPGGCLGVEADQKRRVPGMNDLGEKLRGRAALTAPPVAVTAFDVGQAAAGLREVLRNHLHVGEHGHEIGVALPAGNNVQMQMIGHARSGAFTEVQSHIKTLGLCHRAQQVLPGDIRRHAHANRKPLPVGWNTSVWLSPMINNGLFGSGFIAASVPLSLIVRTAIFSGSIFFAAGPARSPRSPLRTPIAMKMRNATAARRRTRPAARLMQKAFVSMHVFHREYGPVPMHG